MHIDVNSCGQICNIYKQSMGSTGTIHIHDASGDTDMDADGLCSGMAFLVTATLPVCMRL